MSHAVGQQVAILISDVIDAETGDPITGETGSYTWASPDGTVTTPASTTNPGGGNDYRLVSPVFDVPGRWWWHCAFTTPYHARGGHVDVEYNPAAV
jgi:hypothetical protein